MNDFQASNELRRYVELAEGLSLVPYTDVAGKVTWGYGHKQRPGEQVPPRITHDDADALLAADLMVAGAAVRRLVTVEMDQRQFDGLTEFCFNLGEGNLGSSTMLRLFNNKDFEGAATECEKWDHAHVGGQLVELAALKARREWDAARLVPESLTAEQIANKTMVYVPSGLEPITTPPATVPDPNLQNTIEVDAETAAKLAAIKAEVAADEASMVHMDPTLPNITPSVP